ncbi:ATP-binding cassette domain-containing protein [Coralloluteibacterium stylophorae]|uniref:ATP-binding cassette domain-containing protein n=1 Tax=Coralloluteibacterium stylophorae TaxID=1776034 RepID=A0A8J7VSL2_9GAMM|nr:ATP-binding cassette domain-containing protein [Coralloluteibacterium stylophorae]MBS7458183.1 ATP-binding cassette domain-containing protein [Coralloluteibacterium stylophorae]
MFTLTHIQHRYGDRVALEVDLRIEPGRTTALIGPSGAGKSTLLRLLTGLEWPDRGEVRFDGAPLTPTDLAAQRRRIGYVIQEGGLFPHLTARQNAALVARVCGWPTARIAARIRELAALCRLPEDALDRYPGELSGGQRQRVGLVRALMLDPPALLLDEPLGALDPIVRHDLQTDLRALFADLGKTVVLVTHDVAEAFFLAGHVVLLRDGRVAQEGTPAALRTAPVSDFVRRFVHAQRAVATA